MTFDLKTQSLAGTFSPSTGVLFGANGQVDSQPEVYQGTTVSAGFFGQISGDVTSTGPGVHTVSKIGGISFSIAGALTFSGAFTCTVTLTGATSVTFPTSGTLATNTQYSGGSNVGLVPTGGSGTTFLRGDGTWQTPAGSGGTPGGSSGQVQYNSSGSFAGSVNFTFSGAALTLGVQGTTQGSLVLGNTNSTFSTTLKSSNSTSAAWSLTLPTTAGTNGYFLQTDGTGVTSWVAQAGGGNVSNTGTPTNGQIAQWTNATTVQGISTNGSGNVLLSSGTAAIASGKTATISNTLTFTGTDSSTVACGAGGTVAYLGTVQSFTAQQYFGEQPLTDGATINWNLNTQQTAGVTIAGNRTLANPTNMQAGATYRIRVTQDVTGGRTLSYGTAYKWLNNGGNPPTLSTTGGVSDFIDFECDGTFLYGSAGTADGSSGLTIGSTSIVSGTNGRILYDNNGVIGELSVIPAANGGTGVSNSAYAWVGANFGGM